MTDKAMRATDVMSHPETWADLKAAGKDMDEMMALLREVLRDGILPHVLRSKVWSAVNE